MYLNNLYNLLKIFLSIISIITDNYLYHDIKNKRYFHPKLKLFNIFGRNWDFVL